MTIRIVAIAEELANLVSIKMIENEIMDYKKPNTFIIIKGQPKALSESRDGSLIR